MGENDKLKILMDPYYRPLQVKITRSGRFFYATKLSECSYNKCRQITVRQQWK
jgi:hypothetical protein